MRIRKHRRHKISNSKLMGGIGAGLGATAAITALRSIQQKKTRMDMAGTIAISLGDDWMIEQDGKDITVHNIAAGSNERVLVRKGSWRRSYAINCQTRPARFDEIKRIINEHPRYHKLKVQITREGSERLSTGDITASQAQSTHTKLD